MAGKRKNPEGVEGTLLEEKEGDQLESETDESCDESTTKRKIPIVPILLGFILGGILGKLLILILKISGVL